IPCSDYEKLAEIERRMPADRPPKRTRDANADAKEHAESEYYSDVDCVFVRFGQVRASKQRIRDQRCGPETGSAPEGLQSVSAKDIFLSDTDEQHCDEPQKRRCGEIAAAQCDALNAHSASDEHSCSDKSDCCETRDCSIPKKSAECLVNRQTVTVDPPAFESRNYTGHDQNQNQIESAANNNGRRAQRVWSDMELCREECNRGLFQELDCKKNCGRENKKPPAVSESMPTDEQPFDSSHAGLHEFLFA